ncbi:MAG TPA: dihydroneopterin aldolase, partial [Acidimicrobiia bacterium]|nr:dihydroneopterin aldolase [Acidimicrobiia bacterium]
MDTIILTGIRAVGTHGVLPEEQTRPQPFEVDIELACDLAAAGRSDALSDTVDYDAVAAAAVKIVETGHYRLLEALAARIAEACLTDRRCASVAVTVR